MTVLLYLAPLRVLKAIYYGNNNNIMLFVCVNCYMLINKMLIVNCNVKGQIY